MPREQLSILAMGVALALSQLVAMAISGVFAASGFQAFPEPEDPVNAVVYIVMILVFTAVILALVRYRRRDVAKYVILASIFLTLVFVLLLPLAYALYYASPGLFDSDLGGNLATVLAFGLAGLLVFGLVRYPEWYVVDAVGLSVAVGVTAIMGISFGIVPALLLLAGLAAYDAWAVYRTKHMVALAEELTTQRLPVLLVIPKRADYSFRAQKPLREQIESGEEREAMFIGLGDLIIPGVLSVSAFHSLVAAPPLAGIAGNLIIALATLAGSLVGFGILMRFVTRGNPQAGLPLLNGGAIAGFFAGHALVFGSLTAGFL
jgi:presenilin-like A22 family membrane protease